MNKHLHTAWVRLFAKRQLFLQPLVVVFFVLSMVAVVGRDAPVPAPLFAEKIGLGEGVAACFSSAPTITCSGAQTVVTVNLNSVHTSATSFRVDIVTSLNNPEGTVVASRSGIPNTGGSYTITFSGSAGTTYYAVAYKTQDGVETYHDVSGGMTGPTCTPPLTGTLTLKTNPCTIAAGQTTCQPYFDWTTANTYQGSAGRVTFNIINTGTTGTYVGEGEKINYADSNSESGTDGHGAALAAGTYTIKLYGFSLSANTWVFLDSKTQTVVSTSPDLTVSGITPTSAVAGTATTFSATVTNPGGGSTGIGFKNFYQIKSGTVGYTPKNLFAKLFNIAYAAETITDLTATDMAALAAGGSGAATQTYTFPAAGIYGIRVCADKENSAGTNGNPNGLIAESDETNNCGGWTDVNVTSLCTPSCGSGSVCSSGACVLVGGPCTPTNACGQRNSGTYNSSGVCSVSAPAMPPTYGTSCPSVPATNACGMPGSGTILCNGSCSATAPSDTLCLPTVTLSANPMRVRKNTSTKLTWTSSAATSCTLTGQNGFSSEALSGTDIDSTALTAQTTFTLTCSNAYGSKSASVIVNLIPSYIEV